MTVIHDLLFGSREDKEDSIDKSECEEKIVEETRSLRFDRYSQEVHFVRSDEPTTVVWDVPHGRRFNDRGKKRTTRGGDIQIEKYRLVVGIDGWFIADEVRPKPDLETKHEVTLNNVTHREEVEKKKMVLEMYAQFKQWVKDGEVVKQSQHPKTYDSAIREVSKDD